MGKKKKEKKPKTKTVKQKKVKPQKIKQKKVKAPKYIPVKPVFGTAEDYYIYRLNPVETATGALLGGIVGFFFSMVFFRNVIFSLIVGLLLVVPGIRKYRDYLKDKRMKNLLYQFRDMMESLSASYSAGKNTQGAFLDACGDLIGIYGEKADIVKELKLIVDGIYNGQSVEEMLSKFAARSHLDDIESFATIFEATNRYGGDMRRVVGENRGQYVYCAEYTIKCTGKDWSTCSLRNCLLHGKKNCRYQDIGRKKQWIIFS